jgi:hypothetical protein
MNKKEKKRQFEIHKKVETFKVFNSTFHLSFLKKKTSTFKLMIVKGRET